MPRGSRLADKHGGGSSRTCCALVAVLWAFRECTEWSAGTQFVRPRHHLILQDTHTPRTYRTVCCCFQIETLCNAVSLVLFVGDQAGCMLQQRMPCTWRQDACCLLYPCANMTVSSMSPAAMRAVGW